MIPNSGIYCIVNQLNGKRYIGSSVDIRARWRHHRAALRNGRHANPVLQAAWLKHGEDVFVFFVLEGCSASGHIERETWWINRLNTKAKAQGYNLNPPGGSRLGRPHTEATKACLSAKNRGRKQSLVVIEKIRASSTGRSHRPEAKAKIAAARMGVQFPAEHKARLAAAAQRRWQSAEEREKVAAFHQGRKQSTDQIAAKARFCRIISPEGHVSLIQNLCAFCRDHGLNKGHMAAVARGRKSHYLNWRAEYVDSPR